MEDTEPKVTKLPTRAAHGAKRPIVTRSGPSLVSIEVAARSIGPGGRPWEGRGSIDVEQLVTWAFADQRVDRHVGAGLHSIEASMLGLEPNGRSADGCAAIADIQHMGCRVDGGSRWIKDHVHPAAELVAVETSASDEAELLRHYGRLGVRPEGWRAPKRWFRPIVWIKVGVEAQWEWENEGRGSRGARITRVIPTVTPEELVHRRAEYARWHDALAALAWRLSMRALGFTVTGPAAPAEPWLAGEDGR